MKLASTARNSGKALSTVLTIVQLIGIAAVVVWAVLLKRDLATAEKTLADMRARPATPDTSAREAATLRARVATLESQLETAAAMAMESRQPPAPPPAPAPAPANPIVALAASMTNNPVMKNLVATTQKRMLETRFADLFTMLQFSPEQRTRFIDLLQETQSSQTEIGLKMLSGNLSAEEKESLRKEVQNIEATIDRRVREFLGDETKYATYKQYNEQANERSQIASLQASLADFGQPTLTPEQTAALTNLMYAERKNFAFTPNPAANSGDLLAATTPEAVDARMRDQELLNNRIAERAATVLNPQQLAAFRQTQAARQEAIKASAEMSRQLLGGAANNQK